MHEEDPVVEDSIFVFLTDAWGGEDIESKATEGRIGIGVSSECVDAIFDRQDVLAVSCSTVERHGEVHAACIEFVRAVVTFDLEYFHESIE